MGVAIDHQSLDACHSCSPSEWISIYLAKMNTPPSPRRSRGLSGGDVEPMSIPFSASPPRASAPQHLPFSASPPRNFSSFFPPQAAEALPVAPPALPPSALTPQTSSNRVPNPSYVPPKPTDVNFKHVKREVEGGRVHSSVTVSFIGHVDHGKSTLTTTLNRMLKEVSDNSR